MSKDLRPKKLHNENFSHLSETRVSGECIHNGSFLKMYSDVVVSSDGFKTFRDYAVHPGAVAILPFLDDSTLLLERQWRYPLNRSFLEFPAGKIDPGELPIITAQRELLEETGFVAGEWAYLGEFYPVSSYSTEVIFLFMAKLLSEKQLPNTDDGEIIDLLRLSIDDFFNLIENNTISDAKTVSMGFWLLRCLNGEYSPNWQKV